MSKLFLADDAELHDNPDVKPLVVDCMPFVRARMNERVSYLKHSIFGKDAVSTWPASTTIVCMHDCHAFNTTPIPLVRRFDDKKNAFHVYGVFCSINCAKAYILEHEQALTTRRMSDFNLMARTVFKITANTKPAPPRFRLKQFGGDLDIDQFRNHFHHLTVTPLHPPFVSSETVYQEVPDVGSQQGSQMFQSQVSPVIPDSGSTSSSSGMYALYLAQNPGPATPKAQKRKKAEPPARGLLNAFVNFS